MTEIHSCSYYCDRPECIKRQRDDMRERLEELSLDAQRYRWLRSDEDRFAIFDMFEVVAEGAQQVPLIEDRLDACVDAEMETREGE